MNSSPLNTLHPLPATYIKSRHYIFAKLSARNFKSDTVPLFSAMDHLKKQITSLSSIDTLPPFTPLAVHYGSALIASVLASFIKGYNNSRKRKLRKNSLTLDDLIKFDWNLQNIPAMASFYRQVFTMAYVQTDELRNQLFEDAKNVFASGGSFRDWADSFSLHGFEPSNPYHLRTNYDTAANAAYAAGSWQNIEEMKNIFPYLRYVTMQDNLVRPEHAALDGLIFPVDDPFWNTYMPPNDWNCRCSVEQLMESELPDIPQPNLTPYPVNINPQFQNNPGKTNALSLYTAQLSAPPTNWKDAELPSWTKYDSANLPQLFNTDNLTRSQLLDLYANYLGNRIVFDVNNVPVSLASSKVHKFLDINLQEYTIQDLKEYNIQDLKGRFKYLPCIDDTIRSPHEVWFQPDNNKRIYYLKQYAKNIVIIAEIEADNILRYFNVLIQRLKDINDLRQGILLYNK